MALRMAKLERDPKSGSWKSRKVIPADVRAAYGKANETPTWPASLSAAEAKAAWSAWLADIETRIDRLRKAATATPISLTHRETVALAGRWYSTMVQRYENDPGDINGWEAARFQLEAADEQEAYDAHLRGEQYDGPIKIIPSLVADLDELLAAEALVVDSKTRDAVLERMHYLYADLARLMMRRATGDYAPDPVAPTLPAWETILPVAAIASSSAVPLMDLFNRYAEERKPAAATLKAWKRQLGALVAFLGHDDATRILDTDMVAWKDALLAGTTRSGEPRSAKTVRDTYLAVAKTIFGYAVENRLLKSNPAQGITVRGPRKLQLRDRGLTDAEAKIILMATFEPRSERTSKERARAVRWIPWLCAYTGARVNEMTQLRKEDVCQRDDIWVVRITPEAGSTKTNKAREVPLHSHLIEQGFLTMVQEAAAGPLFFNPARHRGGSDGNPQSKKVGEALASWVREIGVNDPNVPPNHGWRHRIETDMRRAAVDFEARHAIVGHAPKTEGGTYGHWDAIALKREIEKLPRYEIADQPG